MQELTLYRRRFIPDECLKLTSDYIHEKNNDYMITSWKSIKPKRDLAFGTSLFLFHEGLKISKFYDHDKNLICWYCDIMTFEENKEENSLYTIDLLADVLIYPDGSYKVVDLDELSEARAQNLISEQLLLQSLNSLNFLLKTIYDQTFMDLQSLLDKIPSPWEIL